ncbi:MAG: zinc-dependent alcohol dehydrogenase family protein [Anaerolineae bacterium]|nr:zinc-dependent alcohol dehydrogenase family protein [Anaerolineae bacterium]
MKAVVFGGAGDVRLEERPRPQVAPGQVLVRVRACGVCGTDRHIRDGEFPAAEGVVLGHEFAGEVVEVGAGVRDLAPGQRVAVDPNIACGICRPCRAGKVHLCEGLTAVGVNYDGGFAEYSVVPRAQLHPFAGSLDWAEAAMAEPLACCLHGIDLAGVLAGQTVLVIGGGAIGQMHAQLARLSGAGRVALSDPIPRRRELARQLGVDAVLDPSAQAVDQMRAALDGGADVVIEAVGSPATAEQSIALAAPGGTVIWFGVAAPKARSTISPYDIYRREITVRGSFVNPFTHQRALALLESGRLQVAPLITRRVELADLPQVLAAPPGDDVKVMAMV